MLIWMVDIVSAIFFNWHALYTTINGDVKKTRTILDNCSNKGYNNRNILKNNQLGGRDVNSQKTRYRLWKY